MLPTRWTRQFVCAGCCTGSNLLPNALPRPPPHAGTKPAACLSQVECLEMRSIGHERAGLPPATAQIPGPLVQRQVSTGCMTLWGYILGTLPCARARVSSVHVPWLLCWLEAHRRASVRLPHAALLAPAFPLLASPPAIQHCVRPAPAPAPARSCCTSPTRTARHTCTQPLGGMPTRWTSTCGAVSCLHAVVRLAALALLVPAGAVSCLQAACCTTHSFAAPWLHPSTRPVSMACEPTLPLCPLPPFVAKQGPQPADLGQPEPGAHRAVPRHPAAGAGQLSLPGGVSSRADARVHSWTGLVWAGGLVSQDILQLAAPPVGCCRLWMGMAHVLSAPDCTRMSAWSGSLHAGTGQASRAGLP